LAARIAALILLTDTALRALLATIPASALVLLTVAVLSVLPAAALTILGAASALLAVLVLLLGIAIVPIGHVQFPLPVVPLDGHGSKNDRAGRAVPRLAFRPPRPSNGATASLEHVAEKWVP
jgi:hypothetical protein